MQRKIAWSLVLALTVVIVSQISSGSTAKALVFPGAVAAPKQRCTLTPVEGTISWVTAHPETNPLGVRAMWDAIVHCEQPSPIEGATVEIRQRLAVRINDNGRAMGPTQLAIVQGVDETPPVGSLSFRGHVRGNTTCDAGVCTLNLETRANGPGGSLRGSLGIVFDTSTQRVVAIRLEDHWDWGPGG